MCVTEVTSARTSELSKISGTICKNFLSPDTNPLKPFKHMRIIRLFDYDSSSYQKSYDRFTKPHLEEMKSSDLKVFLSQVYGWLFKPSRP